MKVIFKDGQIGYLENVVSIEAESDEERDMAQNAVLNYLQDEISDLIRRIRKLEEEAAVNRPKTEPKQSNYIAYDVYHSIRTDVTAPQGESTDD